MSVPFSSTHLRVPRGFGALLEGLAREILRDQPEDIPEFAARYFEALLKQREESGVDPAEWAAKLEDRFYNSHAFKAAGVSQEKEPEGEPSKDELSESLTEDESIHSADVSDHSTTQPNVSNETDSAENTEGEQHEIAEKHIILKEKELSEEESVNIVPAEDTQPDGPSGPEEEEEEASTTFDEVDSSKERDSNSFLDQDTLESKLEPPDLLSFRETKDVCAQELGRADDEVGVKNASAVVDKETGDLEVDEKAKVELPVGVFPFLGLADVQVCATELEETGKTMDKNTAGNTTHLVEEESPKSKPERTVEQSLSVPEPPEGNQEEAEDLAEITKEEGGDTRDFSGGIHESLAHIEGVLDDNTTAKEESLVEISFEDIPKAAQTKEDGEKQPQEEYSVQVLDTTLSEIQQEDECKVSTVESDQNITGIQPHGESEMVGIEKEVSAEKEELGSQDEAPGEMEGEKWNTNDTNLNKIDDKEDEGDNAIILSPPLNPEAYKENLEDEIDLESEDDEQGSEGEFHQNEDSEKDVEMSNDLEVKEDETVILREDEEGTKTEGSSNEVMKTDERGVENLSLQATQSNMSAATVQAERETLETSMQLPHEESALVESQSQDISAEKEVTSKEETNHTEELQEDLKMDSCVPEKNDARFEEEDVSPDKNVESLADDHQEDERSPESEKDTTEPEGSNKEECSRPQEEEDIMDIPLDDPEANRAAAKIQAGFRGHMTRKKMKPEDKTEREEVSSTGDVLNGSQGDTETGGSGAVERDDTPVPEQ